MAGLYRPPGRLAATVSRHAQAGLPGRHRGRMAAHRSGRHPRARRTRRVRVRGALPAGGPVRPRAVRRAGVPQARRGRRHRRGIAADLPRARPVGEPPGPLPQGHGRRPGDTDRRARRPRRRGGPQRARDHEGRPRVPAAGPVAPAGPPGPDMRRSRPGGNPHGPFGKKFFRGRDESARGRRPRRRPRAPARHRPRGQPGRRPPVLRSSTPRARPAPPRRSRSATARWPASSPNWPASTGSPPGTGWCSLLRSPSTPRSSR